MEEKNKLDLKSNNKKILLTVLATMLIIVVIGFTVFIVFDKIILTNNEYKDINDTNNNINDINENDTNNNINDINENDTNDTNTNYDNEKNKPFNEYDCHDNDGCTLDYGEFKLEIGRKNQNIIDEYLNINGKRVIENVNLEYVNIFDTNKDVYFIDNLILLSIVNWNKNVILYAFDNQGNEVLKVDSIDKQFGDNMFISIYDIKDNLNPITIQDNKIMIKASRLWDGPSIRGEEGLIDKNTDCDIIVGGNYEIEYLGNGKFSDIKNITYIKLKDTHYKEYCQK